MTKVDELIAQERANLIGKKKTFSEGFLYDLLTEYINDEEFEAKAVRVVKDENGNEVAEINKSYPVKNFRSLMEQMLLDMGMDAADAAKVHDYKFKKKNMGVMYEFMSEFIHSYLSTGRKLKLWDKEDSNLSLIMVDMDESEKAFEGNEVRKGTYVKYKKHKKIKAKSNCPEWQKTTLTEDQKSVLKQMELIYK